MIRRALEIILKFNDEDEAPRGKRSARKDLERMDRDRNVVPADYLARMDGPDATLFRAMENIVN
jgi:hypothetical protein